MSGQEQAPVVLRPGGRQQIGYALLATSMLGALPLVGLLQLLASGQVLGAVAVIVLAPLALTFVVSTIASEWVVTDEEVRWRRPGRETRSWPRDGLTADSYAVPRYHRGMRVGTQRVLVLRHTGQAERIIVSLLGREGVARLVAAIRTSARPGRPRQPVRGRRDTHLEVDRHAVAAYRSRWIRWHAAGLAVAVSTFGLAGSAHGTARGMLTAVSVTAAGYTVGSIGLRVLRRPAGPVPSAVRVTTEKISVQLPGPAGPVEHRWADLAEVQVSQGFEGEGILRLTTPAGRTVGYSLTGRVGAGDRRQVFPELAELGRILHAVGDARGVTVLDLQG